MAEDICSICERDVPLYRGVCKPCWIKSVESGIHTWEELPTEIREDQS